MKLPSPPEVPGTLRERLAHVADRLEELPSEALASASGPSVETLWRVALASEFVLSVLGRDADGLLERLEDRTPLSAARLAEHVSLNGLSEADAMTALRRCRHVEMARIAWRDLAGWADLETTCAELSELADFSIRAALDYAVERLAPRYGTIRDAAGEPLPLLVLAMGKLGGKELNFSSDIDLVFLYPDDRPDEDQEQALEQYFRRLGQLLIRLLDQVTGDGFVFRVDTRLRPFGSSGPLAVGVGAFESYLVRHGRDWERYAYVKARLVTGPAYERELFGEILTPFVYRRYLDYGVFDALRQMKSLIAREVARRDLAENIKLGPGGIREIEFIAQALQLVRGGQDPELRERSLLKVLPQLVAKRQLDPPAVESLTAAYRFLRTLENRLQAMDDRQTHDLPDDPDARAQLAFAMKEPDWASLETTLAEHRSRVEEQFARVAWDAQAGGEDADAGAVIRAAWESENLAEALEDLGLRDADAVTEMLTELRGGPLYQRMDEPSRQRLAAVVARTVPLLATLEAPATALRRVVPIFEAIGRRSAYLALLNENPSALERLLRLASQSDFIVRQIARHPLLLDELLDARIFESPPSRQELVKMLEQNLAKADAADVEALLEGMRRFQRSAVFRVAVADRLGHLPLMKVSDRLTDIAELVLELALDTAWRELVDKHGPTMCGDPPELREAGFAVVGYGKLGGLELGYGSDLDVVFLHDSDGAHQETTGPRPLDNLRFYARLAQRLIHFLTIQTSSGRLYEVDTRLRPSGRAGLMVASIETFRRYQRNEAWIWEHQALLRSRSVAGSPRVRELFERERRDVLVRHVKREQLKEEIIRMRKRMRTELSLGKEGSFDIKQDPGGLADIEFLIDYWILANAGELPELVEFPDNVRQLEALERTGLVPVDRCRRLKESYLALRERTHELALGDGGRVVAAGEFEALRAWVSDLWEETFR